MIEIKVVKCPICGNIKGTRAVKFKCCGVTHITDDNLNNPERTKEKAKETSEELKLESKPELKSEEEEPEQLPPLNEESPEEQEELILSRINVCGGCGAKLGNTIPFYCPDCGAQLKEDEEVQNADS